MCKNATMLLVLLLMAVPSFGQADVADVKEIIERSVEANKGNWRAEPEYDHYERVEENGHTKTNHVLMILGSPYYRLIAMDGRPLDPQQDAEEEKKLQQTTIERQNESAAERKKRIAKYEQSRQRDHAMMEQLTVAFNFKLDGTGTMDGHAVYMLSATPRPGYQPPNNETKALTGMEGKMWIDKETFQWVKVEAQVIRPVSIMGFLAQVQPGTRFELEQMPVAPGVWLPKHFSMKAHAKVMVVFSHNEQEDDTYYDYQKASGVPVKNNFANGGG